MHRGEGAGHLPNPIGCLRGREFARFFQQFGEAAAGHQFHGEVRPAIRLADLKDPDHPGMLELCQRPDLAVKALEVNRIPAEQQLDGKAPACFGLNRLQDQSAAAPAEFPDDHVTGDFGIFRSGAGEKGVRVGLSGEELGGRRHVRVRGAELRLFEKIALVVRSQPFNGARGFRGRRRGALHAPLRDGILRQDGGANCAGFVRVHAGTCGADTTRWEEFKLPARGSQTDFSKASVK